MQANSKLLAQTESFSEAEISNRIWQKDRFAIEGKGNWKRFIDQNGWQRIRLELIMRRSILKRWTAYSGFSYAYTFGSETPNFSEQRPWLAIRYDLKLHKQFTIVQQLKGEWRLFNASSRDNYFRSRYRASMIYQLRNNESELSDWFIVGTMEWYFLRDPISEERFPNSNQFSLKGVHRFQNTSELGISIKYEEFISTENTLAKNAITLMFQYFLVID